MRNFLRLIFPRPRAEVLKTNLSSYTYLICDQKKCYYCAGKPEAYDHVLPQSVAADLPHFKFPEEILVLVPCCTRCNSIASNKLFMTRASKRAYIRARLYELEEEARIDAAMSRLDSVLRLDSKQNKGLPY
jgi:5-methylcytosine-specific restriction endonuclease McrA